MPDLPRTLTIPLGEDVDPVFTIQRHGDSYLISMHWSLRMPPAFQRLVPVEGFHSKLDDLSSRPRAKDKHMSGGVAVEIDYTNYRGERSKRTVIPQRIEFMSSEWHPEWQWIMVADEDGKGVRYFAMKDIHSWTQV